MKCTTSCTSARRKLYRGILLIAAIGAWQVSCASTPSAQRGGNCIGAPVRFDGIAPLKYKVVTGANIDQLPIYARYPGDCSDRPQADCASRRYVVGGDTLAIAKTCGSWSYAQYIGEKRITVGWVSNVRLSPWTPKDESGAQAESQSSDEPTERYRFRLTSGKRCPVCAAYLQLLNQTEFTRPPYCGRPDVDTVPGFDVLERIPIPASDVVRMSGPLYKQWNRPNPYLSGSWSAAIRDVGRYIFVWKYKKPLSLGNDGMVDRVVLWQGYPLASGFLVCSARWNTWTWGYRPRQLPLVMKPNGQIDEVRTRAIFEGKGTPYWVAKSPFYHGKSPFPFRPIGQSVGLFEYRGVIYFDAFFDMSGDEREARSGIPSLANTLAVFERESHKTRKICEFQMIGDDYPRVMDAN